MSGEDDPAFRRHACGFSQRTGNRCIERTLQILSAFVILRLLFYRLVAQRLRLFLCASPMVLPGT